MNIEEQLRNSNKLLESLLSRTSAVSEEEARQVQEEIDDIEESIEKYHAEVDELNQKLANPENYKREKSEFETNDRAIIEELLSESISVEREDIFKSNQVYRKQQEQQTKMLSVYNGEVVKLKEEIKSIEARLNKDAIAKKRGIAKKLHLSDSEVIDLQLELSYKQELIEEGNQVMEICADEIRRYGRLLNENNMRLKTITDKEQRLSKLVSTREKAPKSELDQYQIRKDKDELAKKLSALEALKNRKAYLKYNPSEEIKKQIEQNKEILNKLKDGTPAQTKVVEQPSNDDKNIFKESNAIPLPTSFVNNSDDYIYDKVEAPLSTDDSKTEDTKEKKSVEENVPPVNEPSSQDKEPALEEKEVEPESKAIVPADASPKELKNIFDAPEPLKEQKLSDKFKKVWRKYRDKTIAFAVAAALTVTASIGLGKTKDKDVKEETSNTTIEQQDDLVKEEFEQNNNFTVEDNQEVLNQNVSNETKQETVVLPVQPEVSTPVVEEVKKEESSVTIQKPIVETTPVIDNTVSTPSYEIPEVEIETEIEEPSYSEPQPSPKLEGVINNSEIETTILQSEGEFVEIPLRGSLVYVEYGATQADVPDEITIKYEGADMYIYSPVNTKSL